MPEWLVEKGIGESRAALIEKGQIVEARIQLEGTIPAGTVIEARLIDCGTHGRNGVAWSRNGTEYLLPHVPPELTQGQAVNIEITRPPIPGPEPWKRGLAKASRHEHTRGPSLAGQLRRERGQVRELSFPTTTDELGDAGWNDLLEEARNGSTDFPGASLGLFLTPAMTLIDVDGQLPPAELMVRGAREAARAIRRLDIGGSIGIDLPTVAGKDIRAAAAEAVDAVLPNPFERTNVNGFGFLQIVRPRPRASLLELAQEQAGFETRALLRRLAFEPPGAKGIVGHPAVVGCLEAHREWTEALAGQLGGAISLRADPALPMSGGYAENA